MPRPLAWWFLAAASLTGCSTSAPNPTQPETDPGPAWFEDVTPKLQLHFRQQAGPTDRYFMPQVMGSGLAVLDVDNDNRLDLLLLNNAGPNSGATHRLFRQNPDGTFRDTSEGSGLNTAGYGMGVAVGDIDNDGLSDVYVSEYGGGRLFKSRGAGRFEDVTAAAGVSQPRWGTSCAFFDYNRDGWLDLVVVNYLDYDPSQPCIKTTGEKDYCHPNQFVGTEARLFRNRGRGPAGTWLGFTDVTSESGLATKRSNGLGVACADFDGDGWPDIFVANDQRANHLWINRKNGTFVEEGIERGIAYDAGGNALANMGVALADVDGDRRLDVFVTHLAEELHTLWRQDTPGHFRDRTAAAGLANPRWRGTGFGTIALDFDHDGNLDIAVVNGRVSRARTLSPNIRDDLPAFWRDYAERNQLFAGTGDGKFRDISPGSPAFAGTAEVTRGLAWADLDGDGGVDLITTSIEGPVRVYRNVAPKSGHWLVVRAYDPRLKRDAIGAIVSVTAGGRTWVAPANPAQSYCSSGDPRAHFGLGSATTVESIIIDWPDGTREVFAGVPADRAITLEKGSGKKP
jgi:hypothetical protein